MANLPHYYDVGTVTVEGGSTTVLGIGTYWQDEILAGDELWLPSQPLIPPQQIKFDAETGTATLTVPWPGASATSVPYQIRYIANETRSTEQTRLYLERLGKLPQLGIQVNAFGPFADRDAYDNAGRNFVYVSIDGNGDETEGWWVWAKLSGDEADWSDGYLLSGAPGSPGVGDVFALSASLMGRPKAGDDITLHVFTDEITFPAGFTNSIAICQIAATDDQEFEIHLNGSEVGTLTFSDGATTGVFYSALPIETEAGDILSLICPAPRDATLQGIAFTLRGSRS